MIRATRSSGAALCWAGEIDELELKVHPIVLGSGVPLFAGPVPPTRFQPAQIEDLGDGVRLHRYLTESGSRPPQHPG